MLGILHYGRKISLRLLVIEALVSANGALRRSVTVLILLILLKLRSEIQGRPPSWELIV
jgi:hypothetical protein